jgi:hypothetical protein
MSDRAAGVLAAERDAVSAPVGAMGVADDADTIWTWHTRPAPAVPHRRLLRGTTAFARLAAGGFTLNVLQRAEKAIFFGSARTITRRWGRAMVEGHPWVPVGASVGPQLFAFGRHPMGPRRKKGHCGSR